MRAERRVPTPRLARALSRLLAPAEEAPLWCASPVTTHPNNVYGKEGTAAPRRAPRRVRFGGGSLPPLSLRTPAPPPDPRCRQGVRSMALATRPMGRRPPPVLRGIRRTQSVRLGQCSTLRGAPGTVPRRGSGYCLGMAYAWFTWENAWPKLGRAGSQRYGGLEDKRI